MRTPKDTWDRRARRWIAEKLVDVACHIDPPSLDLDAMIREAENASKREAETPPAPNYDGTRQSARDLLVHTAFMVDRGYIHAFSIEWLGPSDPQLQQTWDPRVGKA